MNKISDLLELLKHELKDLYSAEVQIIQGLPAMIEKATNPKLKKALQDHLEVTREHKSRLDEVQQLLDIPHSDTREKGFFESLFLFNKSEGEEHCRAMEGLIKEGEKMMGEDMEPEVMDAAIIAAAQKIEHYEISSYGTARAFALNLGLNQVARKLEETLAEEYFADDSLTELALAEVNEDAEDPASDEAGGNGKPVSKTSLGKKQAATGKSAESDKSASGNAAKKSAATSGSNKPAVKKAAAGKSATATAGGQNNKSAGKAASAAIKQAEAKKTTPAKKTAAKKTAGGKSGTPAGKSDKSPGRSSGASIKQAGAKKSAPAKKTAAKKTASKSAAKSAGASGKGKTAATKKPVAKGKKGK